MDVSVGMITYNMQEFIKEALESVLAQKEYITELVICDDASTDNTVDIARKLLSESGWGGWKIVQNKNNLGNRLNAIRCYSELCTGDIIIVADPDDISLNNRFESIIECFSDPNVCLVFSNASVFWNFDYLHTIPLWHSLGFEYEDISNQDLYIRQILKRFIASGCTMAFTKHLIRACKNVDDKCAWDMWVAWMAPYYGKVIALNDELVQYRQHGKNDSKTVSRNQRSHQFNRVKLLCKALANPIEKWFFGVIFFGERLCTMKNSLPSGNADYREKMLEAVAFYETMCAFPFMRKMKRVRSLKSLWQRGLYQQYRGSVKYFALDMINVLLH